VKAILQATVSRVLEAEGKMAGALWGGGNRVDCEVGPHGSKIFSRTQSIGWDFKGPKKVRILGTARGSG
jgi:hypothetical protein